MEQILAALSGSGAMGAVVWILLNKINPKLDEIARGLYTRMLALEAAHDRNTTAVVLRLIASPHVPVEFKEHAAEVLEQAKTAEKLRNESTAP